MKKLITALLLSISVLVASTAVASDVWEVGYRYDDTRGSTVDQRALTVDFDRFYTNGFTLGGAVHLLEGEIEGDVTNRYMVKGGYEFAGPVYVQGALGTTQRSTGSDGEFWQAEAGVRYDLTDNIRVKLAYQYRDGIEGNDNDYQSGPRVGVAYMLSNTMAVSASYDYFTYENDVNRDRFGVSVIKTF